MHRKYHTLSQNQVPSTLTILMVMLISILITGLDQNEGPGHYRIPENECPAHYQMPENCQIQSVNLSSTAHKLPILTFND